ncbi:hypothetical protein EVAR_19392_1 [Eumeta japonica]|uniref:Uncharacterized protein n=1 Tax=Eumeta variegata TaxID=151549 RepID=A0A4C1TRJ4_EUMVA|nr:hypothetical protein EVAR_19392_1 [Eumeta japonica]
MAVGRVDGRKTLDMSKPCGCRRETGAPPGDGRGAACVRRLVPPPPPPDPSRRRDATSFIYFRLLYRPGYDSRAPFDDSISRRPSPLMDAHNFRGVTSASPAAWAGIGYLMEGEWVQVCIL